jgi:hypothetical protein
MAASNDTIKNDQVGSSLFKQHDERGNGHIGQYTANIAQLISG